MLQRSKKKFTLKYLKRFLIEKKERLQGDGEDLFSEIIGGNSWNQKKKKKLTMHSYKRDAFKKISGFLLDPWDSLGWISGKKYKINIGKFIKPNPA